jgi:hypothetical protein
VKISKVNKLFLAALIVVCSQQAFAAKGDIYNSGNKVKYVMPVAKELLKIDVKDGNVGNLYGDDRFLMEDEAGKYYDPKARENARIQALVQALTTGGVVFGQVDTVQQIQTYMINNPNAGTDAIAIANGLFPSESLLDTTALDAAVAAVAAITAADYTVVSYSAVTTALEMIEETQEQINAKTTAITDAIAALVYAGQADLDTAVASAAALVEADYTVVSYTAVTDALALPATTNALVLAKTTAINTAIAELVLDGPIKGLVSIDITGTLPVSQTAIFDKYTAVYTVDATITQARVWLGGYPVTGDYYKVSSGVGTTEIKFNNNILVLRGAGVTEITLVVIDKDGNEAHLTSPLN